ncbi:MAG: GNAT family N-acetyltransferase [Caulobacteraceae bacterium]
MGANVKISPEREEDEAAIADLLDRAFGPGRLAKTAERLREGNRPLRHLSFVAWRGERAVGCVRLWPIRVGDEEAILLGPFAVDEGERGNGLGARLIEAALEAVAHNSAKPVLLVGDLSYYGRFGFAVAQETVLPGPVDPARILVLGAPTVFGGLVSHS